jgi:nucleotide-binding universal stress UspA family protein
MYQRILVPVDGSTTSGKGLDEAIKLARLTGAELRLIHVVDQLTLATGFDLYGAPAGDLIQAMREAGRDILTRVGAQAKAQGIKVESKLFDNVASRVCDTVIEEAKTWGADLIVLGTHGRRGISRWLLGSDAEQIVRMATVPVLLIRASDD